MYNKIYEKYFEDLQVLTTSNNILNDEKFLTELQSCSLL